MRSLLASAAASPNATFEAPKFGAVLELFAFFVTLCAAGAFTKLRMTTLVGEIFAGALLVRRKPKRKTQKARPNERLCAAPLPASAARLRSPCPAVRSRAQRRGSAARASPQPVSDAPPSFDCSRVRRSPLSNATPGARSPRALAADAA